MSTLNNGNPVNSESALNIAILAADTATPGSGGYEIDLAGTITLTGALEAINLPTGVTLDIEGDNAILDGGTSGQRGLFVYSGAVSIENLTIQNMVAQGGAGGNGGGGGGAGLGGGLFIADDTTNNAASGAVTLTAVSFNHDSAVGGAGAAPARYPGRYIDEGGGGGLGGAGGAWNDSGPYTYSAGAGGGGGGIGVGAVGGRGAVETET
ncbi:MAG TPA: hypothetical protein VFC47_14750, partial [Caulobacteraceae bacterium]|nr:hypothetical protein [Caulobacteraceae bacterium]